MDAVNEACMFLERQATGWNAGFYVALASSVLFPVRSPRAVFVLGMVCVTYQASAISAISAISAYIVTYIA